MKRIISALLTVAMLVTLITVPMMVTADAWEAPSSFTNSSDFYNTDLPTLYAVKGTPTVDGVKDAAWDNAFTARVDRSQAALLNGEVWGVQATIYMMWDADYLYILEERTQEILNYKAGAWNNWDKQGCNYQISIPSENTNDENPNNNGGNHMTYVVPGNATEVGTPVPSQISGRIKWYTGSGQSQTQGGTGAPNTYTVMDEATCDAFNNAETGTKSFTTKTNDGYFFETRIPWNYLDSRNATEYTPAADDIFGILFNSSNGKHTNHCGPSNDCYGFQQVQLLDEGDENPTKMPLIPDFSWYDKDATELTITTAEQLLAFCELTHLHGSWYEWFKVQTDKFGEIAGDDAKVTSITKGKTFKLGANIDLNPGTVFNADGTWTGNAPLNGWIGISRLSGATFDGCGYTISGLYAPYGLKNGTHNNEFGFVGRLSGGSTLKNLTLTNGYLKADSSDCLGSFVGVVSGSTASGNAIVLENLYSDLTIVGNSSTEKTGGIYGSAYAGSGSYTCTMNNVIFAGEVTGTAVGAISARPAWGSNMLTSAKNCYVPVGTAAVGCTGNNAKITDTTGAAYIQSTDVADSKINVRLLGLIDEAELDLDSVGMTVTVTYGEETYTKALTGKTDVFATVNAAGTEIAVESLAGDYDYAYGVVLKGVPAAAEDTVTIDVVLTRVIDGVEVQSSCTYSATYVAGVLQ